MGRFAFENPLRDISLEEYLELEKTTEEKLEFDEGLVWSVSGASLTHNVIVVNLLFEIDLQVRDKGCNVYPRDLRVKVPDYPPYRYPDLTANCGDPIIEKIGGIDMLVNPALIVEVLSDSTEAFDRGDKFGYYKSIESFTEYLLVAQHRPHVTQFIKHGDGFWLSTEFNDLSESVGLRSVPCVLSLTSIYRGVTFPEVSIPTRWGTERNSE
jgi:Uma2 family endonuclease